MAAAASIQQLDSPDAEDLDDGAGVLSLADDPEFSGAACC
jgi:hypothetical protein